MRSKCTLLLSLLKYLYLFEYKILKYLYYSAFYFHYLLSAIHQMSKHKDFVSAVSEYLLNWDQMRQQVWQYLKNKSYKYY